MRIRGRGVAIGAAALALSAGAAGGVVAATQSSDDATLRPVRQPANQSIERKVDALVKKMTVDEKLNQLQLLSDGQITDDEAAKPVGGVFSLTDPAKINHYQHIAVEKSRLHIPILFAYDTIHGYRTIFPIPLGAASSFDPGVATADDTIAARETATVGIKQIYSPMVDVSHEPRWGRISEAAGEDPYLGSVFAAARVHAAQGNDYSAPDKVVASVKHYAAYGQPEGGREYNTTDMSESRLHNLYLPPFKAAVDAGADTVMCSFNAIDGVPGCANHETETDLLKKQWGFDGFIESDYTAVAELRACPPKNPDTGPCGHGVAADGPDAAQAALNAGTDQEMVSTNIRDFGKQLLAEHRISMARLDDAVKRILRVKFRAGLFDHPYVDQTKASDPASFVKPSDRAAARKAAGESMVLLKNANTELPLDPKKSVAVIGPLGDDQHDMLGPWWGQGQDADAVSVYTGIKAQDPNTTFTKACTLPNTEPPQYDPAQDCPNDVVPGRRRRGQLGRPGRARPGRDARDERRGDVAHEPRPAGQPAGADRRDQGHRQAVHRRAVQRPPAHAVQGRRVRHRRSSRRGSRAPRPATPWPTCCSGRSTPAASCRSRSRAASARCRSTTTTSRPAARATSPRSTTRATATSTRATRCMRSATA